MSPTENSSGDYVNHCEVDKLAYTTPLMLFVRTSRVVVDKLPHRERIDGTGREPGHVT